MLVFVYESGCILQSSMTHHAVSMMTEFRRGFALYIVLFIITVINSGVVSSMFFFFKPGVTVGFSPTNYTVVEDGLNTVICASLLSGNLSQELSLTFTTIPMELSAGNATSCMSVSTTAI